MLMNFLLFNERFWFVPLILQALAYIGVLKKMGIPYGFAFLPGGADFKLTTKLYPRRRTFWRPFVVTTLLVLTAMYLDPFNGMAKSTARIFLYIAIFIYEIFLLRLYQRLSKAFGHGRIFGFLMFLLPPVFLAILGYGKAQYQGDPIFPPKKQRGPVVTNLGRLGFGLISLIEVAAVVIGIGYVTIQSYIPRPLAEYVLNDTLSHTAGIEGADSIVTREDAMGASAGKIASMPSSREKFFPDHSNDKSVVVLSYLIGTDLEERVGLASANVRQMIEASEKGSNLSFVLEAGGSRRWFTPGIADKSYGRYLVKDGELTQEEALPDDTCMSEPEELADFISWATTTYPADRYILTLWDHGGGLSFGYGYDVLNVRDSDIPTMSVTEIVDSIGKANVKFDIIGFDACLMQNIEIAAALEPYADYFLASEEVEGGFGWFYTSAFGMLAENPGMPSEDLGRELVAAYDPYNIAIGDGEVNTSATLSFVDLPLAKAAYDGMGDFFDQSLDAIKVDAKSFADISLAGTKSYTFQNNDQIDLIDFLERLKDLDYEDRILPDARIDEIVESIQSCVLYRNANSAEGVHGMAFSFPVSTMSSYTQDYKQLDALDMDSQNELFANFFSIMAAQNKKQFESFDSDSTSFFEAIALANAAQLVEEDWYVEGYEDYADATEMVDVPLKEVGNGYQADLPEQLWDIVDEQMLVVYQRDGDLLRYLGSDHSLAFDEEDRPLVSMDGTWVHLNGHVICYEPGEMRETKEGTVFTGRTKALLNGKDKINLYFEWEPVSEGSDGPVRGRILGYTSAELDTVLMQFGDILGEAGVDFLSKGKLPIDSGDRIQLLFDYYDDMGNVVKTEPYGGTIVVTKPENLYVADERLDPCDVEFGGLITDAYQRKISTERIEVHID